VSFQAVQTRRFARQYKKLHDNVAADVDAAIGVVTNSPSIGEELKLIYLEAVGARQSKSFGQAVLVNKVTPVLA
jgi:hypothetical protein